MSTTQTAGTGGAQGEAAASRSGHREDAFLAEMNRQAAAGIPNLDNIGDGRMDYDGPRCANDDCDTAVDNDGEMCEECGDQPHEFRHDGSRFDSCVCGRIRAIGGYSPVHTDEALQ